MDVHVLMPGSCLQFFVSKLLRDIWGFLAFLMAAFSGTNLRKTQNCCGIHKDWQTRRGTHLRGRKPFKADEYSTGCVQESPLAAKRHTFNFRSISVPLMKKVVLKPGERRFAHLKVFSKVTFSIGCYLFREEMECDQEVKQQAHGNVWLFPHAQEFEQQAGLKHGWGRGRHRQHKVINLARASDGGATPQWKQSWSAPSPQSSGCSLHYLKIRFFIGNVECLVHALQCKQHLYVCVCERK